MKLLVRQHLQGMKERGELDVLLPQLLSELGYEVIHHPRIGGRQAGVDVAAVGPDPDADGQKSLLLFVIKSGDVGRADWNGSLQAILPSLDEVIYDYIPNRVSQQYSQLPIAVCVCMGGEIQEGIRSAWRGFQELRTTEKLQFREWNGDRLANLILSGILKQELLDPSHRLHFQKAIALVSEPEEAYLNFRALLDALTHDLDSGKAGTTRLRQVLICLWILVGNGLDSENLEAPYRACELALLHAWDAFRNCPESRKRRRAERSEILDQILSLHLTVSQKFFVEKVGPHASSMYALSAAVRSRSALDINLSVFDMLGRIVLLGHWHHAIGCRSDGDEQTAHLAKRDEALNLAISTINNNPTLLSPTRDDHHIEIGMLMLLAQACGRLESVDGYLREVATRMAYRYVRRSHWVTCLQDYRRLACHPLDRSDAYFQRSTIGSVLVPFVLVGLERLGAEEDLAEFQSVVDAELDHTTQQVWVPHENSEDALWRQGLSIGTGVPVPALGNTEKSISLSVEVQEIADEHEALLNFDAIKLGMLPLFLLACRHHRIPLPPHLWFGSADRES
ncbi:MULTISPECIES: hypothetical protein [unclassified Sulfitobacter]|uniref:hypothetical protein n=1 Tax=unclassified Sulfitobacter TaxID=196795 RepID=UPI0004E39151|nr:MULTISPECIES: hypothetical protein [unclassified Sulfitobacter]PTA97678.1 hypothetical protein C8254_16180 [Sulfitobacter sp. CB-A]ULO22130.1 hypothetical protein IV89_003619 [Sulfitobacter sp. CB2047]